jgi:PadR family transcriptional regulator AphA
MPSRPSPKTEAPAAEEEAALPTIAYAILASLVHEPHSGYELSQLMGPPRNYMWEAKHSQVYPALSLLAREGLVSYSDVPQQTRPDKKVYRSTPAGRAALRAWAFSGPTHVPVRDEFSLRLAALCMLSPDEATAVLEQQIALVATEVAAIDAHLEDFAQRFALPDPVPPDHKEYGLWAAIRLSRELKKTTLAWYRSMKRDLARA